MPRRLRRTIPLGDNYDLLGTHFFSIGLLIHTEMRGWLASLAMVNPARVGGYPSLAYLVLEWQK
jgi:hypothetical protein